jgi:hypothetical protein
MSQKDKVKLGVALVVLVGAGVLIWWNLSGSEPAAPKPGSFSSTSNESGGPAHPTPAGGPAPMPNGGRGQVKR